MLSSEVMVYRFRVCLDLQELPRLINEFIERSTGCTDIRKRWAFQAYLNPQKW